MTDLPTPTELLTRLIQFDASNFGGGRSRGERACAQWIVDLLSQAGYEPRLLHREDAPDRANVVLRVPGADRTLPGVLVHAHLDVVPVEAEQWSVPPFAGLVRDGYVWGRGAQDMLASVAGLVHTLLVWARDGVQPRRDVVIAFVADEEDGGAWGADWLVEAHPELFSGVEVAFGEEGGVSERARGADGRPVTLSTIAAGERGTRHLRLTATGTPGHGSRPRGDDAVTRLVRVLSRLVEHRWPLAISEVVRQQYETLGAALGQPVVVGDEDSMAALRDLLADHVGPMAHTIRPSSVVTVLKAGYKTNVIPGEAVAEVDVRCPPGSVDLVEATLADLIGDDVDWEFTTVGDPLESPTQGPWWDAMVALIARHQPDAVVVPGCMGGGTDAKAFARLGMATYGFLPAPADPEGRVASGYHGIDERIPISQVEGGAMMLRDFLTTV